MDCVLRRLGPSHWFLHVYSEFHDHVRLRFKLASGIGEALTRDVSSPQEVAPSAWCLLLHFIYLGVTALSLLVGLNLSCRQTISNVFVHMQEGIQQTEGRDFPQRQHDKVYDAPLHTSTQARVGALIWSHTGDWITPMGPGRTPTVHWGRYDGRPWVAQPHVDAHVAHVTDTRVLNTGDDHPSMVAVQQGCGPPKHHTLTPSQMFRCGGWDLGQQ